MNYVVLPLSNVRPGGAFVFPVFLNGILIHMAGVGLPTALFAAKTRPRLHGCDDVRIASETRLRLRAARDRHRS